MLLRVPTKLEVFGIVSFYDISEVVSLNSMGLRGGRDIFGLDRDELYNIASETAIIIPVKDEDSWLFGNVIRAIPLPSPLIVVSASSLRPVNFYNHEIESVRLLNKLTGRRAIIVHQRDPAWVEAFSGRGPANLLDEGGVRLGKGEGMILGVLIASWLGVKYVGFIDSNNYIPGAASEYALAYYTGIAMLESRYPMVRVVWPYKGKLPPTEDVLLRKKGRVSLHTNAVLNMALSRMKGIETEIVKTANSGEHVMSVELALKIPWAGRFSVETYELISLLEFCYLNIKLKGEHCSFAPEGVKILQVEPLNPHIHAEKGDEHIALMAAESLGVIYHSAFADNDLKAKIREILITNYLYDDEPPIHNTYDLTGINPKDVISKYLSISNLAIDMGS